MPKNYFGRGEPWTPQEDAAIVRLYPNGGWSAVAEALPHRSHYAIKGRIARIRERGALPTNAGDQRTTLELPRFDSHSLMHRLCERRSRAVP